MHHQSKARGDAGNAKRVWRRDTPAGGVVLPDASLISSAVRMRAMRVEVKCTVLSSAMGMFILTSRWGDGRAVVMALASPRVKPLF